MKKGRAERQGPEGQQWQGGGSGYHRSSEASLSQHRTGRLIWLLCCDVPASSLPQLTFQADGGRTDREECCRLYGAPTVTQHSMGFGL